jgi:hypothetical protein
MHRARNTQGKMTESVRRKEIRVVEWSGVVATAKSRAPGIIMIIPLMLWCIMLPN